MVATVVHYEHNWINAGVAERQGSGLQNRPRRFDSCHPLPLRFRLSLRSNHGIAAGLRDIASARAEPLPWKHRTTKMFGMPPEHYGSVRVAERPGRCGNCAHTAPSLERGWIERCLRFAPQPARCAEILVMDHYTGAMEFCRCRHPFHGS